MGETAIVGWSGGDEADRRFDAVNRDGEVGRGVGGCPSGVVAERVPKIRAVKQCDCCCVVRSRSEGVEGSVRRPAPPKRSIQEAGVQVRS